MNLGSTNEALSGGSNQQNANSDHMNARNALQPTLHGFRDGLGKTFGEAGR